MATTTATATAPAKKKPVVLVTAGSAGLGAAACRLFARNGYRVAVNFSNNAERAEKLVRELRDIAASTNSSSSSSSSSSTAEKGDGGEGEGGGEGEDFIAIRADLGSRADVVRLVREAAERLGNSDGGAGAGGGAEGGRLDAVFSNGGWTRYRGFASIDDNAHDEDWDRAFAVNVKSHLWLLQAAKPFLESSAAAAGGVGAFVSTASLAGVSVGGSSLAYAVTKAAQIHLVRCLAVMAAPNISVNCVSPGLLLTDWSDNFPEAEKERHRQDTKLKRIVTVEDVAEQVFTFVKTKSMTGVNVVMDAGLTL